MYSHYVVVLDWASQDSADTAILGVAHTLDDARAIFAEYIEEEKEAAINNEWYIETDTNDVFEAYEKGWYVANHTRLYIQGVN
ncbi:MAG: hypothetical protein UH850_14625 [Paludibacteraceae bacterium]|nr:hypothetical protein [Paludibacteraceae bacterium]